MTSAADRFDKSYLPKNSILKWLQAEEVSVGNFVSIH